MTTNEHEEHDKQAKQAILNNIEKYGCHLALLEADNYLPAFVYSIGLYKKFNHPEVICFGLSTDLMGRLINYAADLVKQGKVFEPNKPYSGFLEGYDIQFVPVDEAFYADYMGYGGWFYDMSFDFPALQLVWPDKEHLYPWDEGFNPDWKFRQPLLDRNTDFKFYEERNLGVYTTEDVLEGAPILYVYHNENGDWQFHSSNNPDINKAKLVCLDQIVKLDPSVNEIYYLQYGEKAWRDSKDDDWDYGSDS
ncbi:MAG: DUF4262 domain-containing protein [Dysgonomonas sp.]|nr:DUF4262 domain-containing protein [Dysgonomonas sp.]